MGAVSAEKLELGFIILEIFSQGILSILMRTARHSAQAPAQREQHHDSMFNVGRSMFDVQSVT